MEVHLKIDYEQEVDNKKYLLKIRQKSETQYEGVEFLIDENRKRTLLYEGDFAFKDKKFVRDGTGIEFDSRERVLRYGVWKEGEYKCVPRVMPNALIDWQPSNGLYSESFPSSKITTNRIYSPKEDVLLFEGNSRAENPFTPPEAKAIPVKNRPPTPFARPILKNKDKKKDCCDCCNIM